MTDDLVLNNGVTLPPIGFGVFQTPADETADVVATALEVGYRHIDTAAGYFNEEGVGEGLGHSDVPRSEVVVATKLWPADYGYEKALHGFEKSIQKLGLDQIDLMLLHHPGPERFDETIAAYKAMQRLLTDGSLRAIGVSNFLPHHMERLLAEVDVVPAVNQVELHPYFQQPDVVALNAEHGILTQAWSPLGGITFYFGDKSNAPKRSLDEPVLHEIGRTHEKSAAQVMLRWNIQRGHSVIPKSVRRERMVENLDVFDFELSSDELAQIDALDLGVRGGNDPDDTGDRWDTQIPEAS